MSDLDILELWYKALHAQLGIVVACSDIERLRQRLYAERVKAADPQLESLAITTSPTRQDQLWILKKEISLAESD